MTKKAANIAANIEEKNEEKSGWNDVIDLINNSNKMKKMRGRIRSMIGLVDLENFTDLEDDGGFEDEMGLVVQHFEHDGGGPGFDQSQLRVWIFSDDVPVLETE